MIRKLIARKKLLVGFSLLVLLTASISLQFAASTVTDTTESSPQERSDLAKEGEEERLSDPSGSDDSQKTLWKDNVRSKEDEIARKLGWQGDFAHDEDSAELVIGLSKKHSDSYDELAAIITGCGGELVNTVSMQGEIVAVVVDIPFEALSTFIEETQDAGLSRYIEPNMKFQVDFVPDDPYWGDQWGPALIEADYAWNTTMGDPSVLVAVIDTGIDWNHPDLADNYVALGYDWVNSDSDPMDDDGHGTHCAGIVAAVINNSIGIAGLAQVQIMAEKGLDYTGSGNEDDLANAIVHAVDQGADILSNSWGGYGESALIRDAVLYAYDAGVLVIAAAMNDAVSIRAYPAAQDEVLGVTATDQYDDPASFTNFGDWVEVGAPGVDIYSTLWDDTYVSASGTSMAAPHVSGLAALILSQFPYMTRDQIWAQLRYTSDDLGDPGFDEYYGYGRINARRAVEEAPPDHDLLIWEWQRPSYVEPGGTAAINSTILNFGTNSESDITVQLLVNGSIVDSELISSLASGSTAEVSCSWSPTVEGMYNVTSYVLPVSGETATGNNVESAYVAVGFPLTAFVLDSWGTDYDTSTWQKLNADWYAYGGTIIYIDYTTLNIDPITYSDIAATDADMLIISCASAWEFTDSEIAAITQYVHEGHGLIATAGTLYYAGVPNNNKLAPLFGLSDTIMWEAAGTNLLNILEPSHPLFVNVPDPYTMPPRTTVIPPDSEWDSTESIGGTYVALGDYLESAIVVYDGLAFISPWVEYGPTNDDLQLLYNAITWSRYQPPEHELVVSLESPDRLEPGDSSLLNATVDNQGLSNEIDVELYLLINGTVVNSVTIPELVSGASYTIDYLWTPPDEAMYNITAYAPPVPDESVTTNNIVSKMVPVRHIEVALISDDSQLSAITGILDSMGIGYDVYNDNDLDLYTEDLDLLLNYSAVIFYTSYRHITSTEHSTLESYLSFGGSLLVTGFDCLYSDDLLADLVRSSSFGDNMGEDDLYVVDATHPIMNGPYGSFPEGYHISGLYSDCDRAEADTARMAVTVAELEDGYDRIIATEGLPGEVVFWNGRGVYDWTGDADCEAMFKNTLVWLLAPPPIYDLSYFPLPFASMGAVNTTVIIGTSDPHGPCGAAHTLDTVGGMGVTAVLGTCGCVADCRFYLDTDIAWYNETEYKVHYWPVEGLTNIITTAGPGVNMITWRYFCNPWYAPVYMYYDGGLGEWVVATPTETYASSDWIGTDPLSDLVVLEVIYVPEEGRYVLWIGGFGGYATRAGCLALQLFDSGQLPFTLEGRAMLIQWIDENGNTKVDPEDTWNTIEIVP